MSKADLEKLVTSIMMSTEKKLEGLKDVVWEHHTTGVAVFSLKRGSPIAWLRIDVAERNRIGEDGEVQIQLRTTMSNGGSALVDVINTPYEIDNRKLWFSGSGDDTSVIANIVARLARRVQALFTQAHANM